MGLIKMVLALALVAVGAYVLVVTFPFTQQFTTSTSQHMAVDNHTTVTVVNNVPPDYSSFALIILAVALLLYVVFHHVIPCVREWKSARYEE